MNPAPPVMSILICRPLPVYVLLYFWVAFVDIQLDDVGTRFR